MSNIIMGKDPKLDCKDNSNLPQNKIERTAGIDGDPNCQKVPELNTPPCATVIKGGYGNHFELGLGRLGPPEKGRKYGSGLGMDGRYASSHFDLVAGLASTEVNRNRVPDVPVNPDWFRDALHISGFANCNIDEQCKISDGTIGNVQERSAIAMKADGIRVWANEGIKIGTGAGINSKGRKLVSVPPIDFMPGNTPPEMMQPLVRGDNLTEALHEIIDRINALSGLLDDFMLAQGLFNLKVAFHDHGDFISMGAGIGAGIGPDGYFGGKTAKSTQCMDAGIKVGTEMGILQGNIIKWIVGTELTRAEFLMDCMTKNINSRHVNTG